MNPRVENPVGPGFSGLGPRARILDGCQALLPLRKEGHNSRDKIKFNFSSGSQKVAVATITSHCLLLDQRGLGGQQG